METTTLEIIVHNIVSQQQSLMGPLAIEQANKVQGLKADYSGQVHIDVKISDTKNLLLQLVRQYEELFGATSVEVCRDAVRDVHEQISPKDLPDILK